MGLFKEACCLKSVVSPERVVLRELSFLQNEESYSTYSSISQNVASLLTELIELLFEVRFRFAFVPDGDGHYIHRFRDLVCGFPILANWARTPLANCDWSHKKLKSFPVFLLCNSGCRPPQRRNSKAHSPPVNSAMGVQSSKSRVLWNSPKNWSKVLKAAITPTLWESKSGACPSSHAVLSSCSGRLARLQMGQDCVVDSNRIHDRRWESEKKKTKNPQVQHSSYEWRIRDPLSVAAGLILRII